MLKICLMFFIFIVSVSGFAQELPAELSWLQEFVAKYPIALIVFSSVGLLVTVAQAIIFITPTKKDDEWLEGAKKSWYWKIISVIEAFAPVKKK